MSNGCGGNCIRKKKAFWIKSTKKKVKIRVFDIIQKTFVKMDKNACILGICIV